MEGAYASSLLAGREPVAKFLAIIVLGAASLGPVAACGGGGGGTSTAKPTTPVKTGPGATFTAPSTTTTVPMAGPSTSSPILSLADASAQVQQVAPPGYVSPMQFANLRLTFETQATGDPVLQGALSAGLGGSTGPQLQAMFAYCVENGYIR
jgi:hypothetical protein